MKRIHGFLLFGFCLMVLLFLVGVALHRNTDDNRAGVANSTGGTSQSSYVMYDNPVDAEKVLSAHPHDPAALRSLFQYYCKRGEYNKDIIYLKRIADDPNGERIYKFCYSQRIMETQKRADIERGMAILRELSVGNDNVAQRSRELVSRFDEGIARAVENGRIGMRMMEQGKPVH